MSETFTYNEYMNWFDANREGTLYRINDLIRLGINVNITREKAGVGRWEWSKSETAIYYAKSLPHAKILVKAGAEINLVREDGITPLMQACRYANKDVVRFYLSLGANPNMRTKDEKWDALMFACASKTNDRFEMVRTLLQFGARPDIEDYVIVSTPSKILKSSVQYCEDINEPGLASLIKQYKYKDDEI